MSYAHTNLVPSESSDSDEERRQRVLQPLIRKGNIVRGMHHSNSAVSIPAASASPIQYNETPFSDPVPLSSKNLSTHESEVKVTNDDDDSNDQYSDPSDEGADGYGDYANNFLGVLRRGSNLHPSFAKAPTAVSPPPKKKKPRTWDGVFLPVSLSIFGAVLFLRLPWCVGQAGLWLTLLGILCCYTLSGLTLISLAAISTNGIISDGGPYMMVSRTLGPQMGLAVGALFVIANVIASAMYLIGSAPAVTKASRLVQEGNFFSDTYWAPVAVASVFLASLLFMAFLKVERWFRLCSLVLTLLALADMVVFMLAEKRHGSNGFLGANAATMRANLGPNFDDDIDFRTILAILLPGVTGMLAGTTLSGELRHASKAMPRGIGYAWLSSLLVYVLIACLVAASYDGASLRNLKVHAFEDDLRPYLFVPGLVCACFAAVLAGIVGSAKVILGIVKDDLIPALKLQFLAKRPFIAVVGCWFAIQLLVLIGPNVYADASRYTSVVFCCIYFTLNLGTFLSEASGVTSFRPTYAFFNKFTAILGATGSIAMMFAVSPYAASASIVLLLLLIVSFEALHDPERVTWGDAAQPITFHLVRKWLLKLDVRKEHPQHWRPNILQLVADVEKSQNVIHFGNNLKKGGLYVLALAIKGDFIETRTVCHSWKNVLLDYIRASGIKGFPSVTFAPSLRVALQYLMRGCGLGGMRPNTIFLSLDEFASRADHGKIVAASPPPAVVHMPDHHHSERQNLSRRDIFSSAGTGTKLLTESANGTGWMVSAPRTAKQQKASALNSARGLHDTNGGGRGGGDSPQLHHTKTSAPPPPALVSNRTPDIASPTDQATTNPSTVDDNLGSSAPYAPAVHSEPAFGSRPLHTITPAWSGDDLTSSAVVPPPLSTNPALLPEDDDDVCPSSPVAAPLRRKSSFRKNRGQSIILHTGSTRLAVETAEGSPAATATPLPALPKGAYRTRKRSQSIAAAHVAAAQQQSIHHANSAAAILVDHHNPARRGSVGAAVTDSPAAAVAAALLHRNDAHSAVNLYDYNHVNVSAVNLTREITSPSSTAKTSVFKTNRRDADEEAEITALEKMRQIRVMGSITEAPDVMTFADEEELGLLARDACSLQFSVLLGRNFDLLDRDSVAARPKKSPAFIDLWLAEETDPVLFLTAHCLSLTSVWKQHARLRVVCVTWSDDAVPEVEKQMKHTLKQHRIAADVHVVVLVHDCGAILDDCAADLLKTVDVKRGPRLASTVTLEEPTGLSLADLAKDSTDWAAKVAGPHGATHLLRMQDAFRLSLDLPPQRAVLLNRLIRREVARNDGRSALIMTRVDDPPSTSTVSREPHVRWAQHVMTLSQDLPPTVLFCGGGSMMLTQEW